jgi:uncharacterized repeat protein (TIGR03843 family)
MDETLQVDEIQHILSTGEIEISGRFMWGSNYTFLAEVKSDELSIAAVYKPSQGERPLWDFPPASLASREVAAYITSQALGWNLVPPTVLRPDGPVGEGSLQLYVDADVEHHYFTFSEEEKQQLKHVALFDILINNTDRKGGHVLMSPEDHIWSIDHGVCFHRDDKLRTVIWDFASEAIPETLLADVRTFQEKLLNDRDLQDAYLALISEAEFVALVNRTNRVLEDKCFPEPISDRPYPWPLV